MPRSIIRCLLFFNAVFGVYAIGQSAAPPEFDRAKWLQDFDQLLSEMATHYANLEWAIE